MKPVNVEDYRKLAAKRLPRMVFDYLDGGASGERGLHRNRHAWEAITFEPKRLSDVSNRDLSIELFGRRQTLPLVIAPTGLNGALRPDGDVLLAKAAAKTGIPFALSTASNVAIEDLARRVDGELWFQLYVVQRGLAKALVQRARSAGFSTLILTTDVAVNGRRERDMRSGFGVPFRYTPRIVLDAAMHPQWTVAQLRHGLPQLANFASVDADNVEAQAAVMRRQMDASFNWDDLKALRDEWHGTLLVKGILGAADAVRCQELGVDGVIMSNHGGRQVEDLRAPVEALASVASSISAPVIIDSGIRRGTDVVKALALGAKAVMLGRATLYGLAARGEEGVLDVLRMLRDEIDSTIALIGCEACAKLDGTYLAR
jgi:(S)-mandelate dehydrogenase